MLWGTGLLIGFGPSFWEMLVTVGYVSGAGIALFSAYGAYRGFRTVGRAVRIASALGLMREAELRSRTRVVCNQGFQNW